MFGLSRLAMQLLASGGVVAVIVSSCVVRDRNREAATVARIEKASTQDGKKREKKAAAAHARAREPGALDRLRSDPVTCLDCTTSK